MNELLAHSIHSYKSTFSNDNKLTSGLSLNRNKLCVKVKVFVFVKLSYRNWVGFIIDTMAPKYFRQSSPDTVQKSAISFTNLIIYRVRVCVCRWTRASCDNDRIYSTLTTRIDTSANSLMDFKIVLLMDCSFWSDCTCD